ncbi:HTH-type transcriptional regulator DmlR [Pigmentiphaga humi]|uniref:HTH-type transcriptional regulator DmlR n=1 Tax=Pigmentiphaga humi TaxID=2478468 RepID=A0A3P4B307_9BURK|nr:LysR family transcriptional regulator [Pigmentiphaga humi]VCU70090.1 HTH-type transcriptional regulator DmlR [Pigmentiphaga humi]
MQVSLNLDDLMLFQAVVESGSLTAAASRLGVPRATLSRRLIALEKRCGAMLLKRNTRKVSPTALGLDLLRDCADIAQARDSIARKIARSATSLSGTLHVAMPIEFGAAWMGQALSEFAVENSDLQLVVDTTTRPIDLIGEGVDILIAFGEPKPSRLTVRKLGGIRYGLYSSPAYAGSQPRPLDAAALPALDWVVTELQSHQGLTTASPLGAGRSVLGRVRARVNSIRLLREMVAGGTGIGLIPEILARDYVQTGQLVQIVPEWQPRLPLYAYIVSRTRVPRATTVLLRYLAQAIRKAQDE